MSAILHELQPRCKAGACMTFHRVGWPMTLGEGGDGCVVYGGGS